MALRSDSRRFATLAATCALVTGACSGGTSETTVQSGGSPTDVRTIYDFSNVMPGRVPEVTAGNDIIIAYSGTEYDLGHESTQIAVSTDAGATFALVEGAPQIYNPGVAIRQNDAIVIGTTCDPPSEDEASSCAGLGDQLEAHRLDLASMRFEALPNPPRKGFVNDSVGTSGNSAIFATNGDDGLELTSWNDDAQWSTQLLPTGTSRVCPIGDRLVAIGKGSGEASEKEKTTDDPVAPSPSAIELQAEGSTLFNGRTSTDNGKTWTPPVPYASQVATDSNLALGVACGPTSVLVNTLQMAMFQPETSSWTAISMPSDAEIGPVSPVVWTDEDSARTWSSPKVDGLGPPDGSEEGPPAQYSQIRITGLSTGSPRSELSTAEEPDGVPLIRRGAGAAGRGYLLFTGETAILTKVG